MKKKIFVLLLPLLVAAWLSSCHKDKDANKTIIQGHVTEYGTDAPIQGARVYLWCANGEIFGPTGSSFIDSLVTDAEGAFHTEYLDRELCGGVYLSAYKEGFFYKSDIDIHGGVNDLEVVLDPEAWLKIVTIPDIGIYHLSIGGDFMGASGFDVYSSDGLQEHLFQTRGNRMKQIFWREWGMVDQTLLDSIFVHHLDTTVYIIHY